MKVKILTSNGEIFTVASGKNPLEWILVPLKFSGMLLFSVK
jgi:hypothetical protein